MFYLKLQNKRLSYPNEHEPENNRLNGNGCCHDRLHHHNQYYLLHTHILNLIQLTAIIPLRLLLH